MGGGRGGAQAAGGVASRKRPLKSAAVSAPLKLLLYLNNKPVKPEYGEPSAECAAVAGLRKVGWKRAGLSLQSRPLQLSAVDKSPLRGAWVCLHVRSAAAAYGDLGKTRVTPSRALTKAIAAAVEQALAQARQRWAELGLLLSAEEQRRQAFERSAPHIARAISAVVSSSRSAESELQADRAWFPNRA